MNIVALPIEIVNQPSGWAVKDVSTLVIAGFALLVSIISAGFNIWSWRNQGPVARTTIETLHDSALWISLSNVGRAPARVEPLIVSDEQSYDWCRLPIKDFIFHDEGYGKIMQPGDYIAGSVPFREFAIVMHDNGKELKNVKVGIRFAGKDLKIKIPRKIRKEIFQRINEEATEVCKLRQRQWRRHERCWEYMG